MTVSVELSSTNTDSSFESKKATAVVDFFRWFSHNVAKSLTLESVQDLNFRLIFFKYLHYSKESFHDIKYGLSIIASNVLQIILVMKT